MVILDDHKCIFIHVPKTGGSSVEAFFSIHEKTLGLVPMQIAPNEKIQHGRHLTHSTSSHIKQKFPKKHETYFKFAIVRNPYEKMVSHAAWRDKKWAKNIELSNIEFKKIVTEVYNTFKNNRAYFLKEPHFRPQYLYTYDASNNLNVDFVGRYETLEEDWKTICSKIPTVVYKPLPSRMVSRHKPWEDYYTPELRRMVYEMYKKDFELFGYAQ